MKRLLISLLIISFATGIAVGLTRSFFSDTETSTGNTFTAGILDLQIDNTSYYNGVLSPETSWGLDDLDGHLFFDFQDIKPSDWGEDTVSIHVDNNDAWACVNITLTKNDDNTCTDSERGDDLDCDEPDDDLWDGELAQNVNFIFWIDDGDNVLEEDEFSEKVLTAGTASDILDGAKWVLADSQVNNIGGDVGDPLVGLETYYIGKAWCFGTLTPSPLPQDQLGPESPRTPANSSGGVSCDGSGLDNATQTDILMGDIEFYAEQYRNNPDFVCEEDPLLWIIGDIEESQLDNPMDELNWPGAFGSFPTPPAIGAPYTRTIVAPVDDSSDLEFPWNTNYGANYGRNIFVDFSYSGPTIPVLLTVSWSPGRSANEAKEIYLDTVLQGTTGPYLGTPVAGWWEQMQRYSDSFSFNLTDGDHTLEFRHLYGDGTLWDFVKLEKI